MKSKILVFSVLFNALLIIAACGGNPANKPGNGSPLDPQGNWLFTLTDSNNQAWSFAGQLFELVPPTVTGNNGMGAVGPNPPCAFSVTLNGQASGTNSINLTLSAIDTNTPPAYALTGTIATDQQHMSGTFTATQQEGCTSTNNGTWAASQIPVITGTWTGTVNGETLTATVTENVDQTSTIMGQLTGTLAVNGGSCLAAGTYNLQTGSVHVGKSVDLLITDSNGVKLLAFLTVDPSTNNSAPGDVSYAGGSCDGQVVPVTLAKQ
jgi:hypothetical protein